MKKKTLVGIIMGSDSDLQVMSSAVKVLEELGVSCEATVLSAHRTPEHVASYAKSAQKSGMKVIIAGAGMAAALPGVIAAATILPVIGVPVKGKAFEGLDSLLSMAQMPPGIPVATVAVDGAKNAGVLAASIIATGDKRLQKRLVKYKKDMEKGVLKKTKKLEKLGVEKYLDQM